MSLSVRILGCGSSGGVPRIDGDWGACDSNNIKNRRSRCSLLISQTNAGGTTRVLIDTSPDMREQLIAAKIDKIDAVIYTHDHADQTHGIDDLRALVHRHKKRIPVWMDAPTSKTITTRFAYCFSEIENSGYPSILEENRISDETDLIEIDGAGGAVRLYPIWFDHGRIRSLGYRIGDLVYSPDVSGVPDSSWPYFDRVKIWIVDALRYKPHPTHFHLEQALEHIDRLKIPSAFLTNLHIDMDYQTLCDALPSHIKPAYDGLELQL